MNKHYTLAEHFGIKYISFPQFTQTRIVKCAFSTRIGGVSGAPYDSLNLGFTTNDKIENTKKNREIFSKIIQNPFQNPILQVHGNEIVVIKTSTAPARGQSPNLLGVADALVTKLPNTPLTIFVADCFAIYFFDPVKEAVGIAHCGWRSAVKNILKKVLEKMNSEYGTEASDCLTAISAGIGKCCFLVDEDVYEEFKTAYPRWNDLYIKKGNKWSVDLNKIIFRILLTEGIQEENISNTDLCTSCERDLFYSYRRDNGDTGRMAGVITLLSV